MSWRGHLRHPRVKLGAGHFPYSLLPALNGASKIDLASGLDLDLPADASDYGEIDPSLTLSDVSLTVRFDYTSG